LASSYFDHDDASCVTRSGCPLVFLLYIVILAALFHLGFESFNLVITAALFATPKCISTVLVEICICAYVHWLLVCFCGTSASNILLRLKSDWMMLQLLESAIMQGTNLSCNSEFWWFFIWFFEFWRIFSV